MTEVQAYIAKKYNVAVCFATILVDEVGLFEKYYLMKIGIQVDYETN